MMGILLLHILKYFCRKILNLLIYCRLSNRTTDLEREERRRQKEERQKKKERKRNRKAKIEKECLSERMNCFRFVYNLI